jgi:hypothetical protein
MELGSPSKVCLIKLLKHIVFVFDYARNSLMGIALHVNWYTYRPTFAVRKVHLEDATLTTIPMLFIEEGDFAVRPEGRDGGRYISRTEGGHRVYWHLAREGKSEEQN